MRLITSSQLVAASTRQAWYEVGLYELEEGFAIIKQSGANGAKGVLEAWFRSDLAAAEKKYNLIIQQKTQGRGGRQYTPAPPKQVAVQLALW